MVTSGYQWEEKLREETVAVARMLHSREYISGLDGNISVRTAPDKLLCTPSGVNKGFLNARDLVVLDLDGRLVRGKLEPSSEILMHLMVYRERPDVNSVIHAHPPHCVACTLTGISLAVPVVPETAFIFGAVPTAPYATPGTTEVPESIRPFVADAEAVLLERHGSLTVGKDLHQAYNRLETLEHVARILFLARNLGDLNPLSPDELARLRAIVTARGLAWKYPETDHLPNNLVDAIVDRVVKQLGSKD